MPSLTGFSAAARDTALAAILPNGTNRYVALLTALPTLADFSDGVEVAGNGYARVACSAWSVSSFTQSGDVVETRVNTNAVQFPQLTGAVNNVVAFAIFDAAVAGNCLACAQLTDANGNPVTRSFVAGDQPTFPATQLAIGMG